MCPCLVPQRFTLTMFADGEGVNRIEDTPYPMRYDSVAKGMAYQLSSRSHAEVRHDVRVCVSSSMLYPTLVSPTCCTTLCCQAGDYRSFLANYRLRSVEDPRSPLAPLVGSFGGLFRGPSASPASAMGTPLFGTA